MTLPSRIAFCGLAGAGKDEAAWHLIDQGYVRHNFGDVIKSAFNPFTTRQVDPATFILGLHAFRDPNVTYEQLETFADEHLMPYWRTGRRIHAFTEVREEKAVIRGILEHGGDVIYQAIEQRYFREMARMGERKFVNTRCCRVTEARRWVDAGGVLIEVHRPGQAPASDWDLKTITDLRDSGLISHTITNDSPTASHWRTEIAPQAVSALFDQAAPQVPPPRAST